MKPARLVFEDGTVFSGTSFTDVTKSSGEVVFNTAITGYQEIISDPSYCGQIVVMTYPHIGNYGVNEQDFESNGLHFQALIVREYCPKPSNWRSTSDLKTLLEKHQIPGFENFDTRAITRYIREKGAQKALVTTEDAPVEDLVAQLLDVPDMVGQNLVKQVTCNEPYYWKKPEETKFHLAVIDCGVKFNILRMLSDLGCYCHVLPADTSSETILNGHYDGLFISNGPGDPEPVTSVIDLLKDCFGELPIFGICLGHQLIGLALGGKTYKLKFGHHGANHPVKNIATQEVEISSQNHGFCIDPESLTGEVEVSHTNLNDQTVEGLSHNTFPLFSVQYHPESAPGPHDSRYLFEEFVEKMTRHKEKK